MPELPEVETLCRQLQETISGRTILDSKVYDPKLTDIRNLKHRAISKVERQGKSVTIHLDDGQCVLIHLRMTGRLLWRTDSFMPKHCRWRIVLSGGSVMLVDPRRFATVIIQKQAAEHMPNDLMKRFDEKIFLERHAKRKVNVKVLLMDPKAVAGIGNIYACEILHRSSISPLRQASTLSQGEWKTIFCNARRILKTGIVKRGTSISDWYDLYGQKGKNQFELQAYGQEGKRCSICGGCICRIKQGGRSTFYCPNCQT